MPPRKSRAKRGSGYSRPNPRIPNKLMRELYEMAADNRRSIADQIIVAIEKEIRRWRERKL